MIFFLHEKSDQVSFDNIISLLSKLLDMLLHTQQVMPPNSDICYFLMVRTLTLLGKSLYLFDDPRIS